MIFFFFGSEKKNELILRKSRESRDNVCKVDSRRVFAMTKS